MRAICNDSGKVAPTTVVEVIERACECNEIKLKNAALSDQKTDMSAKHLDSCAVRGMMR